jgi:septal ring factor EnvC (AmiA/AmiB activator)
MRSLRTIQSNLRRSKTGSREQNAAELARLEHERARLRRESAMWEQNRLRTEEQLHLVEQRLTKLRAQFEASDDQPPARGDDWQTLALEY